MRIFRYRNTLPNSWIIVAGKIHLFLVRKICGVSYDMKACLCDDIASVKVYHSFLFNKFDSSKVNFIF